MTFGQNLILNNVLYVPKILKNLVSRSLFNKHGFCLVFEFDKIILSKYSMFAEEDYIANEHLKLNVMRA